MFAFMALLVIVSTLLPDCFYAPPKISGAMPSGVYVWQQSWNGDVVAAVAQAESFDRVYVLAAALRLSAAASSQLQVVAIPADSLRSRPGVVACLRIYPFSGDFGDARVVDAVRDAARRAVASLQAGGRVVEELHVDFDAAETQLDAYRGWLERLRADHPALRLSITALPAWLDRGAFARVVRTVDSFVLQLHSLPRPAGPGAAPSLFDAARATEDVRRAARLRSDFRVALPTYGYELIYDAGGTLRSVVAEGPAPQVPEGGSLRRVRADPREVSAFVRALERERPRVLQGIAWYRLPVPTDRMNWHRRTLERVRRGEVPEHRLRAEARRAAPSLFEIDLVNDGDDEGAPPATVEARCRAPIVALDAIHGFTFERAGEGVVQFRPLTATMSPIAPEERRTLGWVRVVGDTEVAAHVLTP